MNYRDRITKTITLPSGAEIEVSKINAFNSVILAKQRNQDDAEFGVSLAKFILTQKTGKLDGLQIVETVKDRESEISIEELSQEDADCIVSTVIEFSGLKKRDEEARKTFPEAGAQNGGECASSGHGVSRAPTDDVVAVTD